MRNSYGPSGGFATNVLGSPTTIYRLGTQNNIFTTNGPNPTWAEDAGPPSRVALFVNTTGNYAEPGPARGDRRADCGDQPTDRKRRRLPRWPKSIRWNFNDPGGSNAGLLLYNTFDLERGGPPPVGVTAAIPNLVQRWMGSTPMGAADIVGPTLIGNLDSAVPIPPGLFMDGDYLRMQGFAIDFSVATATTLPINPTSNSIVYAFTTCRVAEGFEGLTGTGNYPAGWSNGTGNREWRRQHRGHDVFEHGPDLCLRGVELLLL